MSHILVGVCGSIAAFKACSLVSTLVKQNHEVRVVMSTNAHEFISPLSFEAISHQKVYDSEFHTPDDPIPHISLAKWADVIIVAPASADLIGKAAGGIADSLMTSVFLASTCPKILCPAMNVHMFESEPVQRNLETLKNDGWKIVEPDQGLLACQDTGKGRLPDTEILVQAITETLTDKASITPMSDSENELCDEALDDLKPLDGFHVLVSAGPTQESLDPVRFISNHSSGKQGYAIAKDARDWGAEVILVSGPVGLAKIEGVRTISVTSALEMEKVMSEYADWADFIIMAAAVADYRPKVIAENKIKKSDSDMTVEFVRNPDILAGLGRNKKKHQVLCGFAMETEDLDNHAREKLENKNCDLLIANNLRTAGAGFQGDTNVVSLLKKASIEHLPLMGKQELGYKILAEMLEIWKGKKEC